MDLLQLAVPYDIVGGRREGRIEREGGGGDGGGG